MAVQEETSGTSPTVPFRAHGDPPVSVQQQQQQHVWRRFVPAIGVTHCLLGTGVCMQFSSSWFGLTCTAPLRPDRYARTEQQPRLWGSFLFVVLVYGFGLAGPSPFGCCGTLGLGVCVCWNAGACASDGGQTTDLRQRANIHTVQRWTEPSNGVWVRP